MPLLKKRLRSKTVERLNIKKKATNLHVIAEDYIMALRNTVYCSYVSGYYSTQIMCKKQLWKGQRIS